MELRDYIEAGIRIKGDRNALADYLCMQPNHVTNAKAHSRGLPNDACFKLAELLGVDAKAVIAASELATERKEAKRSFWENYMKNAEIGRMAGIVIISACVTNFVTSTPAEAAPLLGSYANVICIM